MIFRVSSITYPVFNFKYKSSSISYQVSIICTLYAPKFWSFKVPVNPPEPEIAEWVPMPSPTFQNKVKDIKKLKEGGRPSTQSG